MIDRLSIPSLISCNIFTQSLYPITNATKAISQSLYPITDATKSISHLLSPITDATKAIRQSLYPITDATKAISQSLSPITVANKAISQLLSPITDATIAISQRFSFITDFANEIKLISKKFPFFSSRFYSKLYILSRYSLLCDLNMFGKSDQLLNNNSSKELNYSKFKKSTDKLNNIYIFFTDKCEFLCDLFDKLLNCYRIVSSYYSIETAISQTYNSYVSKNCLICLPDLLVPNIVSIFQSFTETIYYMLSGITEKSKKFQMIKKIDHLFTKETNKSFSTWLTEDEMSYLEFMYHARHLFIHKVGIIDEDFKNKIDDSRYKLNQHLDISFFNILLFLEIIVKLINGLINLTLTNDTDN
jgi:hypothetical protein